MSSIYESSAPGKVILLGEYAVLEGAPSLVLAVNRRVHVSLQAKPGGLPGIELVCPGFLDAPVDLQWTPHNHQLRNDHPALQLFLSLCNGLLDRSKTEWLREAGWILRVDTRALFDNSRKLGLGSSAALCVALAGLFWNTTPTQGFPDKARAWAALHKLHSQAQGKQGSGIDVAASLAGGISHFRNLHHTSCELQPAHLPANLRMAFVWTGQSASTAGYLGSLGEWRKHHSAEFQHHMQALTEASSAALTLVSDADSLITAIAEFTQRLHEFASASGLQIFAQGHQTLYDLATRYPNLAYKPCGAGGGDLGIALATNKETLAAFVTKIGKLGFSTIDLDIDPHGLRHNVNTNS